MAVSSTSVKEYDTATTCGLAWIANFIAYRCRTCAISPCMSLCAECFKKGNHEGHDFSMFRSLAGGACDCGDPGVMKPTGFCLNHIQKHDHPQISPPQRLLAMAKLIIPRLINRMIIQLRLNKPEGSY